MKKEFFNFNELTSAVSEFLNVPRYKLHATHYCDKTQKINNIVYRYLSNGKLGAFTAYYGVKAGKIFYFADFCKNDKI